ncbi:MAG: hypothetical protein ACTSPN_10930 [Promethearchaeota archaeon]
MAELKIFVDISEREENKVVICQENADKLGLMDGASVEVENPDNKRKYNAKIEISSMVLDFAAQISKNVIDILEFSGVELVLRPVSSTGLAAPKLQIPKIPPGSITPPTPQSPSLTPLPSPPPNITTTRPIPAPASAPVPSRSPQPTPAPVPQPSYAPPHLHNQHQCNPYLVCLAKKLVWELRQQILILIESMFSCYKVKKEVLF